MRREDIDALLFDFGGVLVEIDFERVFARWASLAGVDVAQVRARFSHGEDYRRHERGEIDLATYFASVRADLGIDLGDEDLAEGWAQVLLPQIEPTVALLPRLAQRIPLYLFSNTNAAHHDLWSVRYAEALRPLRRQFLSHRMGRRKPEREAYAAVAREIGVPPERILFFDDTRANIEGARALGMPAVLVGAPHDIERAVGAWL